MENHFGKKNRTTLASGEFEELSEKWPKNSGGWSVIAIHPEWSNSPDDFLDEQIHPRAWVWSFGETNSGIISNFQVTSHCHVLCDNVWLENAFPLEWNLRKLMSPYQPTQNIDWMVAWRQGQQRLSRYNRVWKNLCVFAIILGKIVKLIEHLFDEGLNCQQMFPFTHATCWKWVVPIEAMVVKLNGLSTASCYRCQCILKVGSCTLLIRLIISQGWTCLHTLRQSYAGIPVSNFAYRCRLLTGPRWFFGFNLALVAISIPIFGVKSLLKAWGLDTRMLMTSRGNRGQRYHPLGRFGDLSPPWNCTGSIFTLNFVQCISYCTYVYTYIWCMCICYTQVSI